MNKNFLCSHYCLRPTNRCCCDSRSQETCCSYLISIEEILTWICIGSIIVFFYNTIKLCIIIGLILLITYWICQQTNIPRLLKEFLRKQFNSKSTIDEQMPDDNQQLDIPVEENKQDSLSTKSLLNPNLDDTNITSNNDYTKADRSSNCDDMNKKTMKKSKRNLLEKKSSHQSRTKKLLIDNIQEQSKLSLENSKFTQPDDHSKQNEQMMITNNPSEILIIPDHLILNDIHQIIEHLYDDILQLKTNSNRISDLSLEDQMNLKLATKNLIQTIMSNGIDKKSNLSNEKKPKSSPSLTDDDYQQSEDTEMKSKQSSQSEIIPNRIDYSSERQFQHPKCVTAQPSFAINSIMPRVPTRSIVIAIDEEDDEKSLDNCINTAQHIVTTNEQFENILEKNERQTENTLILKDSMVYNNEQPDWAYYSSKSDLFSTTLHTDLPIIQSEDQHLSFKQIFLSHFHRRSKLTSGNSPATFHSSSLNASDYIKSFESNSTSEQQQLTEILLNDKASSNSIWKKTLKHLKQGIFRVRKSRIIISFDNIQQEKDAGDHDISSETNQPFESAIQEGELLIHHDKPIYQDHGENRESLSEISNGLYNVTSQFILI